MSITAHEFLSILQVEHTAEGEKQDYNYMELLERVRKIIAQRHSKDNSRKYMEIFEATGVEHGKLQG